MLASNLRFAIRSMWSNWTATFAALVALALGIGAATAVFSIYDAVLVRPLPYRDPQRLVMFWRANAAKKVTQFRVSPLNLADYQRWNRSVDLASLREGTVVLSGKYMPQRLDSLQISPDLLSLLGVAPRLGHGFTEENGRWGKHFAVILSDSIWRSVFSADEAIVGKPVVLDGQPHTVVGVMPAGFRLLDRDADVLLPHALSPDESAPAGRGFATLLAVGRLREGVTIEQARTELEAVSGRLREQYPEWNSGWSVRLVGLDEELTGGVRNSLFALLAAVGLLLLIACANVANLLLARAGARQKEIVLRAALGASRGAIAGQLLVESLLLGVMGGGCGALLAMLAISALRRVGSGQLPRLTEVEANPRMLVFAVAVSLITSIVFGLAPALAALRFDLSSALRSSGRGSSGDVRRAWLRNANVVLEVALTVVLLAGCGLLVRSFMKLQTIDRGYQVDQVLSFKVSLPEGRYKELAVPRFYHQLLERLESLPGVEAAAMTRDVPLSGTNPTLNYVIEGAPPLAPGEQPRARFRLASAGYFRALRIPLVRGRYFELGDNESAPAVAIINQALAEQMFPGQDPIGRRIQCGFEDSPWATIVGIVGNTRSIGLDTAAGPETFYPYEQIVKPLLFFTEGSASLVIRVRSTGGLESLTGAVRSTVHDLDPEVPVFQVRTMEEMLARSVTQPRFRTQLISVFAALALLLAMIGLYGVIAYSAQQRSKEIGICIALGAERGDVLWMVVRQGLRLVAAGCVIGLAAAFALAGGLEKLLFGVQPWDWQSFLAAPAIMIGVALAATAIPAWRALRVDPVEALRNE